MTLSCEQVPGPYPDSCSWAQEMLPELEIRTVTDAPHPSLLTDPDKPDLNMRESLSSPRRAMVGPWRHARGIVCFAGLVLLLSGTRLN